MATPTVEPDTDLFANDPDPTAHDNAVSSYLVWPGSGRTPCTSAHTSKSSSTTTGTLQGSPYLDEVRSVVGAGRPRPASRGTFIIRHGSEWALTPRSDDQPHWYPLSWR